MFLFRVVLTALSIVQTLATPVTSSKVQHERRSTITSWSKHRRLDSRSVLPVRVGLKQTNLHEVGDKLNSVSDPASLQYGNHWSPQKIANYFSPSESTVIEVKAWLLAEGFGPDRVSLSKSKGWLKFDATVAEVERLLETEFYTYKHPDGSEHMGEYIFKKKLP